MVLPFPAIEDRDDAARRRLARAAAFRLVAIGFSMPGPEHVATVRESLQKLDKPMRDGLFDPEIVRRLRALRSAWRTASSAAAAREYLRLFHGDPQAPLHETAYGDGRRLNGRPIEMADINGYYQAFGFACRRDNPDLPDHLAAEFEFASLLLVKESYALSNGWVARHALTGVALTKFLEDHLGRWIDSFRASLARAGASSHWRRLAELAAALVAHECRLRRARPAPWRERAPADEMQAGAFACPRGAEPLRSSPTAPLPS